MRKYLVEILRGDAYLSGEVFPVVNEDFLLADPGQIVQVLENGTEALLAEITLELEHAEIVAGQGLRTRIEEAMDKLGQKMRYSDEELEIIVQLSEL